MAGSPSERRRSPRRGLVKLMLGFVPSNMPSLFARSRIVVGRPVHTLKILLDPGLGSFPSRHQGVNDICNINEIAALMPVTEQIDAATCL